MSINSDLKELREFEQQLIEKAELKIQKIYVESIVKCKEVLDKYKDIFEQQGNKFTAAQSTIANRNIQLLRELEVLLGASYEQAEKLIIQNGYDSMKSSYFRTMYSVDNNISVNLNIGSLTQEQLRNAVVNPKVAGDLSITDRIGLDRTKKLAIQRQEVAQGIALGEDIYKIYDRLANLYDSAGTKIMSTARTETIRIQAEARKTAFDKVAENGVKFKEIWNAIHSGKIRSPHAKLDGKAADKDGYWYIGTDKAKHPCGFALPKNSINCRCFITIKLLDLEEEDQEQTYQQWLKDNNVEDPSVTAKAIQKEKDFQTIKQS